MKHTTISTMVHNPHLGFVTLTAEHIEQHALCTDVQRGHNSLTPLDEYTVIRRETVSGTTFFGEPYSFVRETVLSKGVARS